VRFPLRRQQSEELAAAPTAEAAAQADPIPFPAQPGAIDPNAGTWEELLRPRGRGEARMRGQMTSTDARAERLVRQVRNDVAALQKKLASLAEEHDEMLEVDPASVAKHPEAALTLPPAVLVRALVAAEVENRKLRKRQQKVQARQRQLRERLHELELTEAVRASRMQTLEDVIAALHGNLQDLRQEREFLRQWSPARLERPGELPPGQGRA